MRGVESFFFLLGTNAEDFPENVYGVLQVIIILCTGYVAKLSCS